jgi:hypothetical protein
MQTGAITAILFISSSFTATLLSIHFLIALFHTVNALVRAEHIIQIIIEQGCLKQFVEIPKLLIRKNTHSHSGVEGLELDYDND